ncbi:MAG: hypothetical protein KC931_18380, partial [Candidatus Omnitrophica bacterium]|nr:hypothetical protein [Candidatus Omnitrophota bacterium]
RLFEVLIDRLSKKHPLKGLIVDWADREKRLNIGSAEGVEPGQVFNFYFIPDNDPDPWGEPRFRPIGEIRVERVEDHTASFEVLQSESDPKPGMKVKQKLEEN